MVPVLLILGIVVGRWWILVGAGICWPFILVGPDAMFDPVRFAQAAGLAVANTLPGVVIHRAGASFVHDIRFLR